MSNSAPTQPDLSASPSETSKPVKVIGIYGLPGCGKSTLLNQLKTRLGEAHFCFFEGSAVLDSVVPGGLTHFKPLSEYAQASHRRNAINEIHRIAAKDGKTAVVAGHCMFWSATSATSIVTDKDLEIYTHIIYLDVDAHIIAERRENDASRAREYLSVGTLALWQEAELKWLRENCNKHNILLSILYNENSTNLLNHVSDMLRNFDEHNEANNMREIQAQIDTIVSRTEWETVMVVDGDRTLIAEDSGALFWEEVAKTHIFIHQTEPLKFVFNQNRLAYSHAAFRQASLLYEDLKYAVTDCAYDFWCEATANCVTLHQEMKSLVDCRRPESHVGVILVTCGHRQIWEAILKRYGLADKIKIVGNGGLLDGAVVTPAVKGALVSHLREMHDLKVWAFGDSCLDLQMLKQANEAVVVVGKDRSLSMEGALDTAINQGLIARQMLVSANVTPRLTIDRLPLFDQSKAKALISAPFLSHATDKPAGMLLTTPMRDARIKGAVLRNAHHSAGHYLAIEYVSSILGIDQHEMPHVQANKSTIGHKLHNEATTMITAIMRGGESMAFGVSEAFQNAIFKHANDPQDLTAQILQPLSAIILVDSVINSGTTIRGFVEHVRALRPLIPIVVVTGVVHRDCVVRNGLLRKLARLHRRVHLVALRESDNRFVGLGQTDTGNRLFNTTHLP
ncbi:Hypothetical protein R9X50_00746100 [Acrodontium crateriforme]|uniref:Phosphoribosyltransferase domain-containing protein n=1 Tax=Acrodontium crateriforme TaxID=150365 RepID=A0AAQ3MB44_9PEZI|nr:Hypothetical protein R9X50_00746100 [Acrodontium crateriforme]